jgi:general secretion pathway protein G
MRIALLDNLSRLPSDIQGEAPRFSDISFDFVLMKKAFTLIEILIVVVIIGILAGVLLSVINPEALYGRARDSRRQSDLKTLQTGLENYYSEKRMYPTAATWITAGSGSSLYTALTSETSSLNNYPFDPVSGKNYYYWSNGYKYCLAAITEFDVTEDSKLCSNLRNKSICALVDPLTADLNKCLGVENPF